MTPKAKREAAAQRKLDAKILTFVIERKAKGQSADEIAESVFQRLGYLVKRITQTQIILHGVKGKDWIIEMPKQNPKKSTKASPAQIAWRKKFAAKVKAGAFKKSAKKKAVNPSSKTVLTDLELRRRKLKKQAIEVSRKRWAMGTPSRGWSQAKREQYGRLKAQEREYVRRADELARQIAEIKRTSNPKRNGRTIIKAKRVTILNLTKKKNPPRKANITSAADLQYAGTAKKATQDGVKGWQLGSKFFPGSATTKAHRLTASAYLDLRTGDVWKRRPKANPKKKRNALDYSPATPIEVTKHYRSGGPGYETKRQRVIRLGQRDLFAPEASIDELMGYLRKSNPSVITAVKRKMGAKAFAKASPSVLKRAMKAVLRAELAKRKPAKKAAKKTRRNPVAVSEVPSGFIRDLGKAQVSALLRSSRPIALADSKRVAAYKASDFKKADVWAQFTNWLYRREGRLKNPNAATKSAYESFQGKPSTKSTSLNFPNGTPANVYKLGTLHSITLQSGAVVKPAGKTVWLCADAKGKLHLGTSGERLVNAPKGALGKVKEVEYVTTKPHLGDNKPTRYYHELGEETGQKPTLYSDGNGGLLFKGGATYVKSDGIHN